MEISYEILRYINLNFEIVVENDILIKCKFGGTLLKIIDLSDELYILFDDKKVYQIVDKWYNDQLNIKVGDLVTFMNNCRVSLGKTNWEVLTKNNKIIKIDNIKKLFCPRYSENIVIRYFNNWYDEKIIEETERSMGIMINYTR